MKTLSQVIFGAVLLGMVLTGCQLVAAADHVAKVSVTAVVVTPPTLSIALGDAPYQLNASVSPADATYREVVWSSDAPTIASVSSAGVLTPKLEGTTTIRAVSQDDSGKNGTCVVTVTAAPIVAVSSVTLDIKSWDYTGIQGVSATKQLTATVAPSNASNKNITWTSSVPTSVSVDNGLLTILDDNGGNPVTITAASNADNTKKDTCTVTVAFN